MTSKKNQRLYEEEDIVLLTAGDMLETARTVRRRLKEIGYSCSLLAVSCKEEADRETICGLAEDHRLLVTLEAGVKNGGLGEQVQNLVSGQGLLLSVLPIFVPDEYAGCSLSKLPQEEAGVDPESVTKRVVEAYIAAGPRDSRIQKRKKD